MTGRYLRHTLLTVPARPTRALWRLALGLTVAGCVMFGLAQGVMGLLRALLPADLFDQFASGLAYADTPVGLLSLLVLMGAMGLGAMVAAEVVHRRPARSLFGPARVFWPQFLRVVLALLLLNAVVALLPPWTLWQDVQPGLPIDRWVMLLPLTLGALLIQTGAEEVMFRGYLQSQLAARFAHPVVWLTVPSALFAFGHYAPETYGGNAWLIAGWSFAFGVAAADLTARAGSLGPAIAFHLVNNFAAIAVVSMQGDMSGLALVTLPFGPADEAAVAAYLPVDLLMMAASWLAARLALRL
ncbi:CPBP family intramembrane glutamic endopeptidase [Sagittula sp. SSi028]|uniref:CPBP family intramembrane glutamic endopeptidase n=1 Tax=Sagittula sp. SSi028 TaxID=3400636 RepID=UPI003AF49A15